MANSVVFNKIRMSKSFYLSSEKGSTLQKECAPVTGKFFPFRMILILERPCCAGINQEVKTAVSLLQNGRKSAKCVSVLLTQVKVYTISLLSLETATDITK